jgi:molybdenum cofactor cytidylyltransferase
MTELTLALGIRPGDVVCLVGAGGKTTAGLHLLEGMTARGEPAVFTTTTKLLEPGPAPDEALVLAASEADLVTTLRNAVTPGQRVTLARSRLDETDPDYLAALPPDMAARFSATKLAGLPPVWLDRVHTAWPELTLLVDADGARHRWLKAPADHEPVLPACTSLLVPLVHSAVLGQPLDAEHVHRPQRVSALTGLPAGAPVTASVVAAVLTHPEGGLKGLPPSARVAALLNGGEHPQAASLAQRLLIHPRMERVVRAELVSSPLVRAVHRRPHVGAVVLAAGASRRMGRLKQALPVDPDGIPMLRRAAQVASRASMTQVVVVLGCQAEALVPLLDGLAVDCVVNPAWDRGLSTSVRAGLDALRPEIDAALFLPVDQPRLTSGLLQALVAQHILTEAPIVVPRHVGQRGTPVLFARTLWPDLLAVEGDRGGRELIDRHAERVAWLEVDDPTSLADVDTPEDYQRFLGG